MSTHTKKINTIHAMDNTLYRNVLYGIRWTAEALRDYLIQEMKYSPDEAREWLSKFGDYLKK